MGLRPKRCGFLHTIDDPAITVYNTGLTGVALRNGRRVSVDNGFTVFMFDAIALHKRKRQSSTSRWRHEIQICREPARVVG